jgi:hypothetical protein
MAKPRVALTHRLQGRLSANTQIADYISVSRLLAALTVSTSPRPAFKGSYPQASRRLHLRQLAHSGQFGRTLEGLTTGAQA